MSKVYVEIVRNKPREIVKRMGPMDERRAERVEAGASINLNHEEFFTRIVKASTTERKPA